MTSRSTSIGCLNPEPQKALFRLYEAIKKPESREYFIRQWLPTLFSVPLLRQHRREGQWRTVRSWNALAGRLISQATDIRRASRSGRVFLGAPTGYPPQILAYFAAQSEQAGKFFRKALSGPDLTPEASPRAVMIYLLLNWIKTETGRPHFPEVSDLLDAAYTWAGKDNAPMAAKLRDLFKRTELGLSKDAARLPRFFIETLELPGDLAEAFREISQQAPPESPARRKQPARQK
jgi:hypothetical protein